MERKDGVENKAPIPCGSQTFHDVVSTDNLRNNRGIIGRSAGAVKRRCCERRIATVLCGGDRQECLSYFGATTGRNACRTLGVATGQAGMPVVPWALRLGRQECLPYLAASGR